MVSLFSAYTISFRSNRKIYQNEIKSFSRSLPPITLVTRLVPENGMFSLLVQISLPSTFLPFSLKVPEVLLSLLPGTVFCESVKTCSGVLFSG